MTPRWRFARPVSPVAVVLAASAWMTLAGNAGLWRALGEVGLFEHVRGWAFGAAAAVMLTAALAALIGLFAWRWTLKPTVTLLLVVTALGSHFVWSYRTTIDAGMLTNVLQTDVHEAGALVDGRVLASLLLLAVLPALVLWRQPIAYGRWQRQAWRNPALAMAALATAGAAAYASFPTLAPLMRNHKEVRYFVNPLNSVAALARLGAGPSRRDTTTLARTGEDARVGALANAHRRPPLLVLVLGETGRSGNFGLNGYARDTTPELQRENVASFTDAWSCGTSTAVSVPCMFSNLGHAHFANRTTEVEGLLDVLQRAGLAVLWIDNQSGCKGVCDRVPTVSACHSEDCLDEALVDELDRRWRTLDATRRARGTVVVLHPMGSHGPAYHLRSPPERKRFLPECTSAALQDCPREHVVNAYDNSIAYTDHVLARAIGWLKAQADTADTALVYVADHGESLGENHLYLHGIPDAIAPDVQKHVPWITWLSPAWEASTGLHTACLREHAGLRVTHDHYFHTVLGLMDVLTTVYQPALDAYAPCRELQGEAVASLGAWGQRPVPRLK